MPNVSVIIPVYNVEQYLKRCLDSIINQTLQDIEIIIVNDGSTDNSLKICEEYEQADNRIKIVTRKNGGLATARNTGFEHVTGEYIGFIDSDDWVDLDFYEKLYNTAKKYDSDIAYADFIRKGKRKHKIRMHLDKEIVSTEIHDKIVNCRNLTLGCVWNKIYRTNLIQENNLRFPEGRLFEDGIFSMQSIYYANAVVSAPNTYYYYFVNPTSIVKSTKTQKKIDHVIFCQHDILKFLKEKNVDIQPEQFLTVTYKLCLWFLTLLVIKEDWFVKKYYLFGSMPFLTIYKGSKDRVSLLCLGIKFLIRKNRHSYREIVKLNKPYEDGELSTPTVKNSDDTLDELINTSKSICRFGDGEFNLMNGESIPFQTFSENMQKMLKEILLATKDNVMVAIPNIFGYLRKRQVWWRKYAVYNRDMIYSYLDFSKTYYDALISRPYIASQDKEYARIVFQKFQKIWENKEVVFVEGEGTRLGFGNNLFSNAKSVQRIVCPAKNAFEKYEQILQTCLEFEKDKLFILALGPTATVLAYDLAQNGYRALDLGHIDIEYEWYSRGAKKKISIKDKYVNESKNGKVITELKDEEYLNQIYKKILGENV